MGLDPSHAADHVLGRDPVPADRDRIYELGLSRDARHGHRARDPRRRTRAVLGTCKEGSRMWYFTWILGIGLALAFGIINVMWLETSYQVGHLDEDDIYNRFGWRERGSDG